MTDIKKTKTELQQEWKSKTLEFASAVNAYAKRGLEQGWDNAGPAPVDNERAHLVPYLLEAMRAANKNKTVAQFREDWPLAYSPLFPMLEKNGRSIPVVALLEDGRIIARIGSPYEKGYVVEIQDLNVRVLKDVDYFGRSPGKKYFAYTRPNGVLITQGWLGKQTALCPYPTGTEGMPAGYMVKPFVSPPVVTQLIPFPDGKRVLFVSSSGIFVLSEQECILLHPSVEMLKQDFDEITNGYPDEPDDDLEGDLSEDLRVDLSMEHGAISNNGKMIAVGSQDSTHLVFNDRFELIGNIGNQNSYPHYALFSADDEMILFNACHFYNGTSIGVLTKYLPGLVTEPFAEDDHTPVLDADARVYAGVYRKDEFIIGDAYGYIRAVSKDGKPLWNHYIGSTIGDIDISADGTTLVVSTYAGFVSIIDLDSGTMQPYEIGTGNHHERRRWLFWKQEAQPLAW